MIRVLLLSNMYPSARWPTYGVFVRAHVERLRQSGDVDLTVRAIADPRKGWRTPLKYAGLCLRGWGCSITRRFDIVHVHYAYPTALAATVARWRGARMVITSHGGDVNDMLAVRARAGARRAFLHADHIIAVSDDVARKLQNNLGAECPPVSVRDMGVDLTRFSPDGSESRSEGPRLLFVGRLVKRKGVDVLLRALGDVPLPWSLNLYGEGDERGALEELARREGIADRVTFHGEVPQDQLPAIYREADVFIGPSREEPLGLVFLEAAACGCAVISTAAGGIPEIFTHGASALLVPQDDVSALAAAIESVLTDPDLRGRLIDGGIAAAKAHSLEKSVQHTLSVHSGLLGG